MHPVGGLAGEPKVIVRIEVGFDAHKFAIGIQRQFIFSFGFEDGSPLVYLVKHGYV